MKRKSETLNSAVSHSSPHLTAFTIATVKSSWSTGQYDVVKERKSCREVIFDNLSLEQANKVTSDIGKILNCKSVELKGSAVAIAIREILSECNEGYVSFFQWTGTHYGLRTRQWKCPSQRDQVLDVVISECDYNNGEPGHIDPSSTIVFNRTGCVDVITEVKAELLARANEGSVVI